MTVPARRVPVQACGAWYLHADDPRRKGAMPPGTIAWDEHVEAWRAYARKHGGGQSAGRIAGRGGFAFNELCLYLGRPPSTWRSAYMGAR
jgi:hypothetical protein